MTTDGSPAPPTRQSRHMIEQLYGEARLYIALGAAVVGAIFSYFILKDIPLGDGLTKANGEYVQAFALWFYYLCWITGCPFDAYYQKWVYQGSKSPIKIHLESVALVIFLVATAILFLWFRHNERIFSIMLAAFIAINIVGWAWILYTTRSIVASSREAYRDDKDYIGLTELEIVNEHMAGRWQIGRFVGMSLLLGILIIVLFVSSVRAFVASGLHRVFSVLPLLSSVSSNTISTLIPDALLILFIMFAEGVIWYRRLNMRAGIRTLEALEKAYVLKPNPELPAQSSKA